MSDNEHIKSLQGVRQLLVGRRRYFATLALEYEQMGDKRWPDSISEVVSCQRQIEVVDAALDDERKSEGSVYERRGLAGA